MSAFILLALASDAMKGGEPIKDPAKARQRAQLLMRQFSIDSNGRLEANKKSVKEILEEVIKTCPDTAEAGTAKVYLKYLERMDAAIKQKPDPKAKPLFLGDILARQQAQVRELAEAQRSGNDNISLQVKLDHFVERAKWKGNHVFGSAILRQVSGSNLVLCQH